MVAPYMWADCWSVSDNANLVDQVWVAVVGGDSRKSDQLRPNCKAGMAAANLGGRAVECAVGETLRRLMAGGRMVVVGQQMQPANQRIVRGMRDACVYHEQPSEEILLPEDKLWPFLLRFPVSSFGICLGVSSQAIMWKTISSTESTKFLHISPHINQVFWFISIYALKLVFYWEAVRREYHHPIRVNFFFAPWIALLFLAMGIPPSINKTLPKPLWYVLMTPIFCLEVKIYGQWMSGGQRRLSKVANPCNHLSVVENFILPTNETLPKELHSVFFLFVAAPSVASMAWVKMVGSFDFGSRIAYFIAMFLYLSLAIRVNFFRGIRFSLAWWAYTFLQSGGAACGNGDPCLYFRGFVSQRHGHCYKREEAKSSTTRRWYHRRAASSDAAVDQYLKFSDAKDAEVVETQPAGP
ncbi:hypothetical protein SASPL_107528 [Salvia splendens]|uniref:Uncharacterized protein n=1 Tax=Salvia splendens TaxID=180675 RepID=A0A8X9A5D8_SALSN|nr:hypothetical protein SASPL_107528 [Salvia splendens]